MQACFGIAIGDNPSVFHLLREALSDRRAAGAVDFICNWFYNQQQKPYYLTGSAARQSVKNLCNLCDLWFS